MAKKTSEDMKDKIPNMGEFGDFEKHFKNISDDIQNRVMPMFKLLSDEQAKLNKPLKRKNILIDDTNCVLSLIIDGRVVINFATINEGQEFFEKFTDFSECRNKWWYKLFTYFN